MTLTVALAAWRLLISMMALMVLLERVLLVLLCRPFLPVLLLSPPMHVALATKAPSDESNDVSSSLAASTTVICTRCADSG